MIDHADGVHAYTHKQKPTLGRTEASKRTIELWEELQNITKNEEAWYIIEHHLSLERLHGAAEVLIEPLEITLEPI